MRFALHDLELSEPLPALRVPPGHDGLGVVARLHGVPVGFAMRPAPAGTTLDAPGLAAWLGAEMATRVIEAAIREELAAVGATDPPPPSLTIAVCTRDRPEGLRRCLESVRAATCDAGSPVDLLVVDNASTDPRTAEVAAALGGRCVREPMPGLDVARNRALAEARGDWLAFIDDDAVMDPGWHRGFARAARIHADAGALTGLVLPLALDSEAQIVFERCGGFRRGCSPLRWAGSTKPGMPYHPAGAGIFGTGCNMVFRRDLLAALGGFDPALDTGAPLPGGGDLDIFYRVVRAGHALAYEPTMTVRHEHRATLDALRRQYWTWGLGFMAFVAKTWGADVAARPKLRGLVGWWIADQLRGLATSIAGRRGRPPGMVAAELAGGLVGLTGTYRRSRRRMAPDQAVAPVRVEATRARADAPWAIEHVDLGRTLPALPAPSGAGGVRVVFWLGGVPLGSADLAATELPLAPRPLGELAARVVAPGVGWHLVRRGFEPPLPLRGGVAPPAVEPADVRDVAGIDRPLARLRDRFAAAATADTAAGTSVVVCTLARPQALARCLASLARAEPAPDEVIVVDNAPEPDAATRAVVTRSGVARYVSEPRSGLSAARNAGVRQARGGVIAFTDDDVVVDPAWVARLAAAVREPGVDAATGLVLPARLETEAMRRFEMERPGSGPSYRGQRWDAGFFRRMRRWGAPVWRIGAGANMAFRREVFDRLGGFDERLGAGAAGCSEDSEMWYRVLRAGGACRYDPTAVVHHHHREDLDELRRQMRAYMRGHVAALLVQWARHGDAGNLYRLLVTIPAYYAARAARAALHGFRDDPTLASEVAGVASGVGYYLRVRDRRPWPAGLGGG
jgi:GT2 family glycosyltransferase